MVVVNVAEVAEATSAARSVYIGTAFDAVEVPVAVSTTLTVCPAAKPVPVIAIVTGSVQVLRLVRVTAPRLCVAAVGVVTPTACADTATKPPSARAAATMTATRLKVLL